MFTFFPSFWINLHSLDLSTKPIEAIQKKISIPREYSKTKTCQNKSLKGQNCHDGSLYRAVLCCGIVPNPGASVLHITGSREGQFLEQLDSLASEQLACCPFVFYWQDYISDLAKVLQLGESEEFVLECVGILGNLTIPDLDYELLLTEYSLVPWIQHKIQPGMFLSQFAEDVVIQQNNVWQCLKKKKIVSHCEGYTWVGKRVYVLDFIF